MKIETIDLPENVIFEIRGDKLVYKSLTIKAKLPEPSSIFVGNVKFVSDSFGNPVRSELQCNPIVFEVVVNPRCYIDEVREKRFAFIDRIQTNAKMQIFRELERIQEKYKDLGCQTLYQIYLYRSKLEVYPADNQDEGIIGWIIFSNLAMFGV